MVSLLFYWLTYTEHEGAGVHLAIHAVFSLQAALLASYLGLASSILYLHNVPHEVV